ncbi:hypothetical protein D104_16630 [Marinomonas profundimaris]|uniref:Uncharacterized protein n=1 Tax=Marinomonas profundimaris TaxID=1208321 RepID=W1RRN7_9GAMM|nr:hypothetical protein D104_16630 [Marinomonas profundimaris]
MGEFHIKSLQELYQLLVNNKIDTPLLVEAKTQAKIILNLSVKK